jgi:hypothetical protein
VERNRILQKANDELEAKISEYDHLGEASRILVEENDELNVSDYLNHVLLFEDLPVQ